MERPIIFSTEMVKAILDGRKTMTRRVIKPQPFVDEKLKNLIQWKDFIAIARDSENINKEFGMRCPYGQVGDRLWVRETWRTERRIDNYAVGNVVDARTFHSWYKTTPLGDRTVDFDQQKDGAGKWRPSIFMPRWASRIDEIIALLKVERLLDISEADARAEGFNSIEEFLVYWDILNKKRGYGVDKNPWNWVIGW